MNFLTHTKWALLWAVLIFILCALPGKDIPFENFWDLFNLDKLIHASLFFIQATLLIKGFVKQNRFQLLNRFPGLLAVLMCVVYGGALELMQGAFYEDRTADLRDFVANTLGALLGALLFKKTVKITG